MFRIIELTKPSYKKSSMKIFDNPNIATKQASTLSSSATEKKQFNALANDIYNLKKYINPFLEILSIKPIAIANYFDSATHTSTSANGWTLIAETNMDRSRASLLYKIAGASKPASYIFAVTSSSRFSPLMEINNNKVNPNS